MAFSREMFPQEEIIISHRFMVFCGLPIKKEQFFWTKSTGPPVSQGFQHLQGDFSIIVGRRCHYGFYTAKMC